MKFILLLTALYLTEFSYAKGFSSNCHRFLANPSMDSMLSIRMIYISYLLIIARVEDHISWI